MLYKAVVVIVSFLFASNSVDAVFWDDMTVHQLFPANFSSQLPQEKLVLLCFERFLKFVEDLHVKQEWARTIIDSWGTGPSGLFTNNNYIDYGYFDQCIKSNFLSRTAPPSLAKYVVVEVSMDSKHFHRGVCLPQECSIEDMNTLMKAVLPKMNVEYHKIIRQQMKIDENWTKFELKVLLFSSIVVGVVILSTLYEIFYNGAPNSLFTSFSLVSNGRQLLQSRSSDAFTFLDGIKAFSFFQIVLFHVFCCGYSGSINATKQWTLVYDPFYFFTHAALFAVDTFFLISGLLLSYHFMLARQRGSSFNIVRYYLRRYLRLFPPLFAMDLVLAAFVFRLNGPNPAMAHGMSNDLNFYFTYNAYRPLYHLWYVNAEIKLYLVSPLFLFPLLWWGFKSFPAIACATVTSIVYYKVRLDMNNGGDLEHQPETRCGPWLLGLKLGYIIFRLKTKKIKLVSVLVSVCSIITSLTGLLVIMYMKRQPYETHTFTATSHTLWGFLLAWPIILLSQGNLPSLNWFLSHPIGQMISKLAYCGYLWHLPIMHITTSIQQTPILINGFLQLQFAIAVFVLSLVIAVPWSLLFETPVMNLEKVKWFSLFKRNTHNYSLLPSNGNGS